MTKRTDRCSGLAKAVVALLPLFFSSLLFADSLFKACNPAPAIGATVYLPIKKVQPVYPRSALRRGKQGWVDVRFTVMKDGSTANQQVIKSYPDNSFNAAAIKAVKGFQFEPARKNGVPVATPNVTNRVTFELVENPRKINSAIKQVRGWLAAKDYGHASAFLDREIARQRAADPFSAYVATLRYLKGVTLALQGDADGALSNFVIVADRCKQMCTLSPNLNTLLYIQTGNIYASRSQWQQASDYYKRALEPYVNKDTLNGKSTHVEPDPTIVNTYASYAIAAINLGDWCSAENGFATAISAAKEQSIDYPKTWQKGLLFAQRRLQSK